MNGSDTRRDTLESMLQERLSSDLKAGDITVRSDQPHWISLEVACRLDTVYRLAEFMYALLMDINSEAREKITLAFRELLVNAVEHGGHLDPDKRVALEYVRFPRSIVCCIRDPGDGFSFDGLEHAALSSTSKEPFQHLELRDQKGIRPGGMGMLVAKNSADELVYNSKGNEVMFIKYLR